MSAVKLPETAPALTPTSNEKLYIRPGLNKSESKTSAKSIVLVTDRRELNKPPTYPLECNHNYPTEDAVGCTYNDCSCEIT